MTARTLGTSAFHLALLFALLSCGGEEADGQGPIDPPPPPPPFELSLANGGGGNNVEDRFTSDLWIHGGYAYTGTWGGFQRKGNVGDALFIWSIANGGAPQLVDSIIVPGIATVSDVEVSSDGAVLMFSAEGAPNEGLYLYDLSDPAAPVFLDSVLVETGHHTATFGEIGGRRYAFAAKNPADPALEIYDVTDPANIELTTSLPIPPSYGIHDTYVRDGLAFVFAWDSGVIIYDVGNGVKGGSPESPVEVSRLVTAVGTGVTPAVHNGWWFHNPVTDEQRYLFIGQEGPGIVGNDASGDIHVVDIADLENPREVAVYSLPGAGAHNFWMDEDRQVLYAAYYNGGVVALDVSGTLSGDLSDRLLDRLEPGGPDDTYTWGVMFANDALYASDMVSGLWRIAVDVTESRAE